MGTVSVKPLGPEYIRWSTQTAADRRGWVEAKQLVGKAELDAFAEGVRQGYLDAVNALVLHGHCVRKL